MSEERQVVLSKDSWHYKLLSYCWRIKPEMFFSLCPYFWLTVGSIFCFIPIWLGRTVWNGFVWFGSKVYLGLSKYQELGYQEKFLPSLTKDEIFFLRECRDNDYYNERYIRKVPFYKRFYDKLYKNPEKILDDLGLSDSEIDGYADDFFKKFNTLAEIEERRKELKAEEERVKREKERSRKQVMYTISGITKNIFLFLFTGLLGVLGYFISWIIAEILIALTYDGDTAIKLLEIISGFIALVALGVLSGYIVCKSEETWKSRDLLIGIDKLWVYPMWIIYFPFKFIWIIMFWIWKYPIKTWVWEYTIIGILSGFSEGFKEFGGIFGQYFSASFNDFCPGIDWKEGNKKC